MGKEAAEVDGPGPTFPLHSWHTFSLLGSFWGGGPRGLGGLLQVIVLQLRKCIDVPGTVVTQEASAVIPSPFKAFVLLRLDSKIFR